MAGKLDEISASIGALQATTATLTRLFDRHCQDDDRRHQENSTALREIKETLAPLPKAVAAMEPIVNGYAISQGKKAYVIGLALTVLGVLAWILEQGISVFAGWLFHR